MTHTTGATCPTCHEPVSQPGVGRPRIYCSSGCRREMVRLRRELADLEEQLVEQRYLAKVRYGQWAASAQSQADWLEPRVEAARARIPEEMQ